MRALCGVEYKMDAWRNAAITWSRVSSDAVGQWPTTTAVHGNGAGSTLGGAHMVHEGPGYGDVIELSPGIKFLLIV